MEWIRDENGDWYVIMEHEDGWTVCDITQGVNIAPDLETAVLENERKLVASEAPKSETRKWLIEKGRAWKKKVADQDK